MDTEFNGKWSVWGSKIGIGQDIGAKIGRKSGAPDLVNLIKIAQWKPDRIAWFLTGQEHPRDFTGQKAMELDKLMTEAEFRTLCIKVLRMEQKIEDLEAQVRLSSSRHAGGNTGKGEEEPETP